MKKIFFTIVIFLIFPNISYTKTSTKSSGKMHQYCKLWVQKSDGKALSTLDTTKGLACSWYFKGMFDSSVFVHVMNSIKSGQSTSTMTQARLNGMCAPKNISTGQWIRVFVKYLDDNPQNLNRSAAINSAAALKKYYRCKR